MDISDADLIAKLTITEDPFTERKSNSDRAGWLKTVVAFANSTPIDQPAVLFVGVDNAGAICPTNGRIEDLMKSFSDYIAKHVYPPVYTFPKELRHGGLSCLAVIVPGSARRPHFAGQSYIRDGTQTREASEDQFAQLIAFRQGKAGKILGHLGEAVNLYDLLPIGKDGRNQFKPRGEGWVLVDCDVHFVTIGRGTSKKTIPLEWLDLAFDHAHGRIELYVRTPSSW